MAWILQILYIMIIYDNQFQKFSLVQLNLKNDTSHLSHSSHKDAKVWFECPGINIIDIIQKWKVICHWVINSKHWVYDKNLVIIIQINGYLILGTENIMEIFNTSITSNTVRFLSTKPLPFRFIWIISYPRERFLYALW